MAKAGSRPGATSKKKGATKGTGGHGRKALEGRGPTPKAEDRVYHKAYKMKRAAERRAATGTNRKFQTRLGGKRASDELVTGRNAVLEALRTEIPSKHLYIMSRIEVDDRVREIMTIANKRNIPMLEIPRSELDRLTDGAVHQGVAMQIPPYKYPDATDLVPDTMERWHSAKLSTPPICCSRRRGARPWVSWRPPRCSWRWMALPTPVTWVRLFVACRRLAVTA